jgi:hypothetical protein
MASSVLRLEPQGGRDGVAEGAFSIIESVEQPRGQRRAAPSFPEAPHGFACTSPEPGRLLTISAPARVFEAFVADTSAANGNQDIDVHAVFGSHGFELA